MKKCKSFQMNSKSYAKRKDVYSTVLIVFVLMLFSACNARQDVLPEDTIPEKSPKLTEPVSEAVTKANGTIVEKEDLDMTKTFIVIYDVYGAEEKYIQLDTEAADSLSAEINSAVEISITDKIGTDTEFLPENIYLYIGERSDDFQSLSGDEYSVLMNSNSELCLRNETTGKYYKADDACKSIVDTAAALGTYHHITKDDIKTIAKAELSSSGVKSSVITDEDTLSKIEDIFINAKRIVNPSTFNLEQVLTLTNSDGGIIEIELDDSLDICIIGHTYWYDYGPGTNGKNARNARSELFALLGLSGI